MSAIAEVLSSLKGFPSRPSVPSISLSEIERQQLDEALHELLASNNNPEAAQSILQVALRYPTSSWNDAALQWADREGDQDETLIETISRCIAEGLFDGQKWLSDSSTPRSRRRATVISWAQQNFNSFLDACELEMSRPESRLGIVTLILAVFMESPADPGIPTADTFMAQMAEHTIIDKFILSLLIDTGNRLFATTVRTLFTAAPFAPRHMTQKVPLLMAVLGRAVCWRDRPFESGQAHSGMTQTPSPDPSLDWSVATSDMELAITLPDYIQPSRVVQILLLAMYGGWPSNLIAFVRDPAAYLKGKNVQSVYDVDWASVWQPGILASRTVPLLRDFQLHPSIIAFTSAAELADDKRWNNPSEFVSLGHLMVHEKEVEAGDIFDFLQDFTSAPGPSRIVDPQSVQSNSDTLERLKQENELLRLEARHTDRIRKQYLYHISRLHRNSLRFNSDEAEIHTFVNRIKDQSKSINTLTSELSQQRTDASQAQQKHVNWQEQLRDKVATFREERRNWQTEASQVRGELGEAKATIARQMEELAMIKNERFQLQNQLLEVKPKIRHIEDYEIRIKQLTATQQLWDNDIEMGKVAERERQQWESRCYELEKLLKACTRPSDQPVTTAPQPIPAPPKETKKQPDPSFYISVAENAIKRSEKLERENLELQVQIEQLQRLVNTTEGTSFNHLL